MKLIFGELSHYRLALSLGWNDVQQTYKRSKLGPFWISIGSAVNILAVSLVYGLIFKIDLSSFLPYITISMIVWGFMASNIAEACQAYSNAEGILKQMQIPLFVFNLRVILRNLAISAHNIAMLPLVFIVTSTIPTWNLLMVPISLIVVCLNLGWIGILLSLLSTRYRDFGPIVSNVLQVAFYVTPVIWYATALPGSVAHILLGFNPLYHWLQILRLPVLGIQPTLENWFVSVATLVFGWCIALPLLEKFRRKVTLWL